METDTLYFTERENKMHLLHAMKGDITPAELEEGAKKLKMSIRDVYCYFAHNTQQVQDLNEVYSYFSKLVALKKASLDCLNH